MEKEIKDLLEIIIGIKASKRKSTLQNSIIPVGDKGHIEIRPLTTDELPPETLDAFLNHGDFC